MSRPVVRPNLVAASEIQTNSNLSTLFENSHRNLFALSAIQVNALNGLIRSKGVDAPADVDTSGVRNELTQKERLPSIKKPKGTRKSKRKSASTDVSVQATPETDSVESASSKPRIETIFTSSISDQPAKKDTLGFEPYVKAIADFLTNERTVPPLTLSIEGEWGSGKSSFMAQLQASLLERGNLTLQFNAWRHDKHEELWAAFALEFIRQISTKQKFWRRWWANFTLRRRRFDLTEGWLDLIRAAAVRLVLLVAVTGDYPTSSLHAQSNASL